MDKVPETFNEALDMWDMVAEEHEAINKVSKDELVKCFLCGRVVSKEDSREVPFAHFSQKIDVCFWCEDILE